MPTPFARQSASATKRKPGYNETLAYAIGNVLSRYGTNELHLASRCVIEPNVFERLGECVVYHFPLRVARALGIDELVGVAFPLQDFCQPRVGDHPIATALGGRLGTVVVFRDLDPDSEGLLFAFG